MIKSNGQIAQEQENQRRRERERRRAEINRQLSEVRQNKKTYENYRTRAVSAQKHIDYGSGGIYFMQGAQKNKVINTTKVAINPNISTLNLLGLVYDGSDSYNSRINSAKNEVSNLIQYLNSKIDEFEEQIQSLISQLYSI